MKLTKKALFEINTTNTRLKIALALSVTERTIQRYIEFNDESLTKAAAMQVIREVTKMKDAEILEREVA